jgi:CRISPR-associated protein Csm4
MPEYTRIKLTDMTPFHLGKGRDYYDFSSPDLQSDTLTSALAALRAERGKSEYLESFLQSFALSSAFPYYGNHYFLPKMCARLNVTVKGRTDAEYRKRLKKIKYIEEKLWLTLASTSDIVEVDENQIQGKFLLDAPIEQFTQPIKSSVMQRVKVPRADEAQSEPFFFEWNYVYKDTEHHKEGGLYCLLQADSHVTDEVVSLFGDLGKSGIGSDKSVGGGCFSIETEQMELTSISDANSTVVLSMYIPTEDEIKGMPLQKSQYEIVRRGGFMAGSTEERFRHLHKRSVYMFACGSVFPITTPLTGKVVNLVPSWNDPDMHPVYRGGRPFCVTIKKN